RDLWRAIAELNYCMYWNQYVWDKDKIRRTKWGKEKGGWRFQHRVVGRTVNVVATKNMAEYIQGTIERLTRERLHGEGKNFFTAWAIRFREGIADEVITKIYERRKQLIEEERLRRIRE